MVMPNFGMRNEIPSDSPLSKGRTIGRIVIRPYKILWVAMMMLFLFGCAYIKPVDINKQELKTLHSVMTLENEIEVAMVPSLYRKFGMILPEVDRQFDEFRDCVIQYGFLDRVDDRIRQYRVAVVTDLFECRFHRGRCGGEFDPGNGLIIVAYELIFRDEKIPLFKHELAHLYGILPPDHNNLERVKVCTKY
jgi:hypothetical protein